MNNGFTAREVWKRSGSVAAGSVVPETVLAVPRHELSLYLSFVGVQLNPCILYSECSEFLTPAVRQRARW
jgi:hypothetical protein